MTSGRASLQSHFNAVCDRNGDLAHRFVQCVADVPLTAEDLEDSGSEEDEDEVDESTQSEHSAIDPEDADPDPPIRRHSIALSSPRAALVTSPRITATSNSHTQSQWNLSDFTPELWDRSDREKRAQRER